MTSAGRRRPNRRRRAVLMLAALTSVVAATASGCVTMPKEKTGAAPAWAPISAEDTQGVVRQYDRLEAKALRTGNADLLRSVESGPLLRARQGALRVARGLDSEGTSAPTSPKRSGTVVRLPRFSGYPVWFLAVSTDGARKVVDMMSRPRAGSTWKAAQSVVLDQGVQLPALAGPAGTPVVLPPAAAGTLIRPADKTASAYALLLAGGPKSPQAWAFVPHPQTDRAQQAAARNAQSKAFVYRHRYEVTSVRALATADGGALELFTLNEIENFQARPPATLEFDKADPIAAFTEHRTGQALVRATWVWQVVARVPARGKGDGKVRLLGVDRGLASVQTK
ncbi:hypothetical protein SAMN05421678_11697 [Actinopolymorpha cephalotaxi]|uniref:DUF8094 domain-containing protein n=1 Tax=Actinopolymorpha cephalotaxi TaxID=504797 RepID=A0A1I2ZGZ1_9ACTN|nr:hypothetical protein [Actinopolymorpha cephalotaxi]NYH81985.1 hypothetical protein [Actinopolymorpha cephalotaxi]SFH37000.1 hypothetical protein SAMN05421678_11697 [Actinopolymorpha cephalotaxi]